MRKQFPCGSGPAAPGSAKGGSGVMKVVECGSKQRVSQSHTHEATCELHKMSGVRECIDVKSGTVLVN